MSPFEYLNTINDTKKDIMTDDMAEKSYNGFMINRSLSYFNDTVQSANMMNRYHHIDNKLQYHFLINMIRKRKRFSKWIKKEQQSDIKVIKKYYGYNNTQAQNVLSLLSAEQLQQLHKKVNTGGKTA